MAFCVMADAPLDANRAQSKQMNTPTDQGSLGLRELIRLRAIAFLAQIALLLAASLTAGLQSAVQLGLWALVFASGVANVALASLVRRGRIRATHATMGYVLLVDTALLTGMLLLSGGPSNPFSVFYIVHVALAARLLDARWAVVLGVATSAAFGILFFLTPASAMHAMHHGNGMVWHLRGMWVSYTLAAAFVGHFVARMTRAIELRDQEIARVQRDAANTEKLAALGTLAGGAAHELGTPLSTIAVVAGELVHAAKGPLDADSVRADAELLRREAARCREIVGRMSASAGQTRGEAAVRTDMRWVAEQVRDALGPEQTRLDVAVSERCFYTVPREALVQVLLSLVSNALYASLPEGRVHLRFAVEDRRLNICVSDEGSGMSAEVLARAIDPFFSTKAPGEGMGLGLYLAHGFATALGGQLRLESEPHKGTRATLLLTDSSSL